MKATEKVAAVWERIARLFNKLKSEHDSVCDECVLMNRKRLLYGAAIGAVACLVPILLLLLSPALKETNPVWRYGVILANTIMCAGLATVWSISFHMRKAERPTRGMKALHLITAGFFLLCGVCVTLLDQLQTGDMSAFMLACVTVGTILLLRPAVVLALYIGAYVILLIVARTIVPPETIFSVLTNGCSAACMGTVVSIILWRTNCVNIMQSRQLEEQKSILERRAHYDMLTGLSNRCVLDNMIQQKDTLESEFEAGALVMMDLDDFKRINDSYGHPAGDAMLRQIAQILKDTLRKTDFVSRFGGEEFMVALPKATLEEATGVAEKLRWNIECERFVLPGGIVERMTASFGVASIQNEMRMVDPYTAVDRALYAAKRAGKNRVACFGTTGTNVSANSNAGENETRKDIPGKE